MTIKARTVRDISAFIRSSLNGTLLDEGLGSLGALIDHDHFLMLDVLLTSLDGTAAVCSLPDLTAKLGHNPSIYRTHLWYQFSKSSVASTLIFSRALAAFGSRTVSNWA